MSRIGVTLMIIQILVHSNMLLMIKMAFHARSFKSSSCTYTRKLNMQLTRGGGGAPKGGACMRVYMNVRRKFWLFGLF